MRRRALVGGLLGLSLILPGQAAPATIPSLALAVSPKEQAAPFNEALKAALLESRRFVPAAAIAPVPTDQPLDNVLMRLRKATKASWVFAGTLSVAAPALATPSATASAVTGAATISVPALREIEVRGRLYDLVLGDATKELRFRGTDADWSIIARQIVLTLKSRTPLRAEVTGLRDQWVLLNLGSQDGVSVGDLYRAAPKPAAGAWERPLLRIVEVQPWFCTAELVKDSGPSRVVTRRKPSVALGPAIEVPAEPWRLIPGDTVIEDVGYALVAPPKAKKQRTEDEEGLDEESAPAEDEER